MLELVLPLFKKGLRKAIIEGTFSFSEEDRAIQLLKEAGFDYEDEITFTREIPDSGKSVVRIDHRIVSLSLFKDILQDAIDIHGQRENAYLLNVSNHRILLDRFANNASLLAKVEDSYKSYESLLKEKEEMLSTVYNENDLEYFKYQIEEIQQLHLQEEEEEQLIEEEKQYRSIRNSLEKYQAIQELYESEVSSSFYELNKLVQSLKMKI